MWVTVAVRTATEIVMRLLSASHDRMYQNSWHLSTGDSRSQTTTDQSDGKIPNNDLSSKGWMCTPFKTPHWATSLSLSISLSHSFGLFPLPSPLSLALSPFLLSSCSLSCLSLLSVLSLSPSPILSPPFSSHLALSLLSVLSLSPSPILSPPLSSHVSSYFLSVSSLTPASLPPSRCDQQKTMTRLWNSNTVQSISDFFNTILSVWSSIVLYASVSF